MREQRLSIGEKIELVTERLAYGGEAVARHHGLTVFVQGAAPDERVGARIVESKKNFARAVVEKVLVPSPARRQPPCPYFGDCGGCQLQHLTYAAQLEAKAGFIGDALTRIGHLNWTAEIEIRSAAEFGYRSRAQIKIDNGRDLRIGFNRAASHSVCDVENCPILLPQLNDALHTIRSIIHNRSKIAADRSEIEIAAGDSSVSSKPFLPPGDDNLVNWSQELSTQVAGATYVYSPATFFQVNALLLDEFVKEATGAAPGKLAIDLYTGVGLFTIQLARHFENVIGVEADHRAYDFALKNLKANHASNVKFIRRRADEWLRDYVKRSGRQTPDLVLLDPPRSGAAECIELIANLEPAAIRYVSCDPATLARDLRALTACGYSLNRVVGFDLFPQTYHVETIAFLSN